MNWWQFLLMLIGIGVAAWLIPAAIFGYALGGIARQVCGRHHD